MDDITAMDDIKENSENPPNKEKDDSKHLNDDHHMVEIKTENYDHIMNDVKPLTQTKECTMPDSGGANANSIHDNNFNLNQDSNENQADHNNLDFISQEESDKINAGNINIRANDNQGTFKEFFLVAQLLSTKASASTSPALPESLSNLLIIWVKYLITYIHFI